VDSSGPASMSCASGARRVRVARKVAATVVAAGCALPLGGCALFSNGGTLNTPVVMTVSSGTFLDNTMPQRYTCANGKVLTPPLAWAGAPAGTKSIALVVDDSNTPITPYVYWIVFDINPATSDILEGQLPPGARQAQNSAGQTGYDPPCPGALAHGYRFTVYALNSTLKLSSGTSLESAWMAIAAATIGRGTKTFNAKS
jgi:Raf kinase inhibitor-like YbhB/YbcL family protein